MLSHYIFSDSSLPVGSFIFSHGLESKFASGKMKTERDLTLFIQESCLNLLFSSFPFISKTFKTLESNSLNSDTILKEIISIDAEIDLIYSSNKIQFNSSKISGNGYLTCLLKSQIKNEKWLIEYKRLISQDKTSGHFPISFAVMGFYLGLNLENLKFHMILSTIKNLVSAAVRLNIINAFTGVRITLDFEREIPNLMSINSDFRDKFDYANTNPLLDIYQGRQEYLYSKLFHS